MIRVFILLYGSSVAEPIQIPDRTTMLVENHLLPMVFKPNAQPQQFCVLHLRIDQCACSLACMVFELNDALFDLLC